MRKTTIIMLFITLIAANFLSCEGKQPTSKNISKVNQNDKKSKSIDKVTNKDDNQIDDDIVPDELEWAKSFKDAVSIASQNHKLVMAHITATWCTWCRKMEKETFTANNVKKLVHKNFVPVKIWEHKNPELIDRIGASGFPNIVFFKVNDKGNLDELHRIGQYVNREEFENEVKMVMAINTDDISSLTLEQLIYRGQNAYMKSKYDEALDLYGRAMNHKDTDDLAKEEIRLIIDACRISTTKKDDLKLAIEDLKEYVNIVKRKALRSEAVFYLGYALYLDKNYSESRKYLNIIVKEYPDSLSMEDVLYLLNEMKNK